MGSANNSVDLQNATPPVIDPEIFELDEFWIYIYAVYNTNDIRGIIPYDNYIKNIKKLSTEMRIHYNNTEDVIPKEIEIGKYYALFDDEWYRVRCVDYDSTSQSVTVLFIDRGDMDTFSIDYLQDLDLKFCVLPAQSVQLSLYKLEVFYDCELLQNSLDDLLLAEKNVYVKIMGINQEDDVSILSVDIIVEQDNNDEIYVNELLLEKVFETIANPNRYIGVDKVAQEACISHISDESVFVQIKSKGLIYFHMLLDNVIENRLNNQKYTIHSIKEIDFSKVYIANYSPDNSWYRAQIIHVVNESEVQVMFIDIGSIVTVKKIDLFLLEDVSEVLARYPEQAIRVILYKISPFLFDENMANYLYCLADTGILYMKVMDFLNEIPVVQFHKRTENNTLLCINDALVVETSFIKGPSICEQKVLPLKTPDIPEDDAFFDVRVTMAANPENIIVQPLCSTQKFDKLMNKLLYVCESFSGPHLTPDCVKIGHVYAALNEDDDSWFRACICRIINKNLYTVYACDYGDYKVVPLKDLQPLQEEFLDLPYQAIKARLIGVKNEVKENWSVTDSLKLNDLIVCKNYVSYINSREFDDKSFDEVILNLVLIDTSSEEDIFMSDLLNNKFNSNN